MLKRLRRRLTLLAALLTGAVLVLALSLAFAITRQQYLAQRQAAFYAAVGQVQYQWGQFSALDDAWLAQMESQNGITLYLEENGVPLLFSSRQSGVGTGFFPAAKATLAGQYHFNTDRRPLAALSVEEQNFTQTAAEQSYRCAARLSPMGERGWRCLIAAQNTAPERAYLWRLALRFAALALAGCAGIAAACWFVAGRAIRPVGDAMEKQQQFLSVAGHELRTPLAVIRANVGAAVSVPEKTGRCLRVIDEESGRMGGLVDDLLLLSAGASARLRLSLHPLAPDAFLLDFAESMEATAAARGRHIETRLPPEALPVIEADEYRLRQLLMILTDNALRYEPPGGRVLLSAVPCREGVAFRVTDHGPGVPKGERQKIFDQFYRGPAACTDLQDPDSDPPRHFGLGLSVAKELAGLHDARLFVEDRPDGAPGAVFVLVFRAKR